MFRADCVFFAQLSALLQRPSSHVCPFFLPYVTSSHDSGRFCRRWLGIIVLNAEREASARRNWAELIVGLAQTQARPYVERAVLDVAFGWRRVATT